MSPSLPSNRPYTVTVDGKERKKVFSFLNFLAPFLKIGAFFVIIISFFTSYYMFIAAAGLWAVSMLANRFKYRLTGFFEYTLSESGIKVVRWYIYPQNEIIFSADTGSFSCSVLESPAVVKKPYIRCFSPYISEFDTLLLVKTQEKCYLLNADKYFYAFLKEKEGL